jgi:hypothetical protein
VSDKPVSIDDLWSEVLEDGLSECECITDSPSDPAWFWLCPYHAGMQRGLNIAADRERMAAKRKALLITSGVPAKDGE